MYILNNQKSGAEAKSIEDTFSHREKERICTDWRNGGLLNPNCPCTTDELG